jgi:hypothetical protein
MSDAGEHGIGETKTFTVAIGPILREALALAGPGEDVDEALLRTLKRHYPDDATNLLSAVVRIAEVEARRASVDKREAMRRLAHGEANPELTLRSSGGDVSAGGLASVSHTFSEQTVVRIGDEEYHSLDEVPSLLRPMVERGMSRARQRGTPASGEPKRRGVRLGCSWAAISALLRLWRP